MSDSSRCACPQYALPAADPADRLALMAPHLAHAQAIARRLLGCDHLAADAVQEALVACWCETTTPANPRAWLVRAVVYRSRHLRRTLQRRVRHEHIASQHCELHRGCDNPLHQALAHELGAELERAKAVLPAGQLAAFELYEQSGIDYDGIAARLSLPVGTVRSRLHRARAALQLALQRALPGCDEVA